MKTVLGYIYFFLLRTLLALRYKIKVKGMDKLPREEGALFLANHPAEIDPCILLAVFWRKFHLRPVATDYLFRQPVVRYLLDFVKALPIPSFESSANSYKRRQIDKTYDKIFSILDQKENLLIYPAGGLKHQAEESIGGASGVHYILNQRPDTSVVLIRTTGLWGSSFSRALTGKTPDLGKAFFHGFKVLLKNGLFFAPRREVVIECSLPPDDFPWKESRRAFNRYLEKWYNSPHPEPLNLVSYSFWRKELPEPYSPPEEEEYSLDDIPEEIKDKVLHDIAELASVPEDQLQLSDDLATDLGLDSLDMAQLVVSMKEEYGVLGVQTADLTTVGSVLAYASRVLKKPEDEEVEEIEGGVWVKQKGRPPGIYPEANSIPEAFFKTCDRMGSYIACVDKITGEVSYKQFKIGIILLAQAIRELPGERIGIMMPASVAVNAVILASMLAGKVPVMINWTLGERNLRSITKQSGIQVTISSWNFLDRLNNVDLNGLDDQIILLEEMRRGFTLSKKIKAFLTARKRPRALLKAFGTHHLRKSDVAVILFTSGTESVPKGVPLTHENIMANQKGAFQYAFAGERDVLLGVLPPFHSFGFSVTGLFPLLAGVRIAYYPNPTDGRRIAMAIERWNVTLLCMAPTFLKGLLRVAKESSLRSLRLVVSGAEKAPKEMFEQMHAMNPETTIIEGYGITECGPILTINPPDKPVQGVGIPLPEVEIVIVHPEKLEELPIGEQGLILARGPNVFQGYLDPNLPAPFVEVLGKSWYQTGDLGYLNSDGYLTISGRLKRFIKIGGEMISLGAVETALVQAAGSKGWEITPDSPCLAVCAVEDEGKKSEMHLFVTFDTHVDEVNTALREAGMSNLIKMRAVHKVAYIPILGAGKIDYKKLTAHLKESN